ncbi:MULTISPECIES: response regulator transcription factor [Cyanophyceae]|jgi:two-component system, chemotaxis family, response regulator PixH|uniref:Response regulator receiver protein n=3 Tax=Cyanophyceae TaxID=3028117 RepID=K9U455_CHRTP|nr:MULTISPECIES: response regulator [Cyanophyceae]PSB40665.1 response regulator [Cyanosarcina cf. burmensis CCALA 770]AFY89605.1 response regulator receiver protein [Chroococcidiopsis thermalis PCC 7203]MDV2994088.1 Phosphate regulon transcriptional regulatory protein PhoB [Chroococcidiopsis sp. SAG 2025]MDZ4878615.1 Phosphate regulon transcriptional regulatory protein PhoB [Chroococcidiopsis cubana SAG 39.79]NHC35258.1 response regulator [Scytonema millei VB511283]
MDIALVVEDCLTEREAIASYLQQGGISVLAAKSGEEALEKMSDCKPDIIILDVVLPGRSGFELCRALKANPSTKNTPVILCSRKGTDMDKFWGLKQGADAYLPKPVAPEEFIRTVKQLLLVSHGETTLMV